MEYVTLVFSVLGVVFLILITYYGTRWFTGRMSVMTGNQMRVVERLPLGQTQSLAIVKVGKAYLLVGVSAHTVTMLCELDADQLELFDTAAPEAGGFAQQLKAVLSQRKSGTQKGSNQDDHTQA